MPMGAAPGLPPGYESAEQTVTLGALLTLSHGLGVLPKLVRVRLKCATAEGGFAVGDVIESNPGFQSQNTGGGHAVYCTASTVFVRISSAGYQTHTKGTGAPVNITAANWRMIVSAFA